MGKSLVEYRLECWATCYRCKRFVEGWIGFSDRNQIVDSGEFMVFAKGALCDECVRAKGLDL